MPICFRQPLVVDMNEEEQERVGAREWIKGTSHIM
jgi:hypothetical protein